MATEPAHPAGKASDSLMMQVTPENVLQVRNAIKLQADAIRDALQSVGNELVVGFCGKDPTSSDAASAFNPKIQEVTDIHWRHHAELSEAVVRLSQAAQEYGLTEQQIDDSFKRARQKA